MPPKSRDLDRELLGQWCRDQLGSPPADELFATGHLSVVIGLRLTDGREIVIKIRPDSPRIAACVEIQRRLYAAGYPCPEPLTDAVGFGSEIATAEAYVPGGADFGDPDHAPESFAGAFAWLMRLAPRPDELSTLDPPPSWADWNHSDGLWPRPEDSDLDLNVGGADWIDEVGRRARVRLLATESEPVIGHCDWLAGNLRWREDNTLLVVHDWDSMIADSEAVPVGFAAALHPGAGGRRATVEDSERFLDAYCQARGRHFSLAERQRSWAAGLWTRAYDAKYQDVAGVPVTSLSRQEAYERVAGWSTASCVHFCRPDGRYRPTGPANTRLDGENTRSTREQR